MVSRKPKKANKRQGLPEAVRKHIGEGIFIITLFISAFLLLALLTYHGDDPGWSQLGAHTEAENAGGLVGAWFADMMLSLCGYLAYIFPLVLIAAAWMVIRLREHLTFDYRVVLTRTLGFVLMLLGGCSLAALTLPPATLVYGPGGIVGQVIAGGLQKAFNPAGANLFTYAFLLVGATLFAGVSWIKVTERIGLYTLLCLQKVLEGVRRGRRVASSAWQRWRSHRQNKSEQKLLKKVQPQQVVVVPKKPAIFSAAAVGKILPVINEPAKEKSPAARRFEAPVTDSLPSLQLLDSQKQADDKGFTHAELEAMSRLVESKLMDFGIQVHVVAVHPGPVITRFEMQLAPGLKVSKITALAKDLARSLAVTSVRIVDVIPGKPVVGLELPNPHRKVVGFDDVLASKPYAQARSPLSLALGVDIAGHSVVVDLAKMPHLLVAGTTGSGKSVGLNAMLLSILFKSSPQQVRLIMIDPKMLELSVYEGIPHLLTPVVTDMKEAANALRWSVAEMERRYRLMAALGVRNISGYNSQVETAAAAGKPIIDPLWQGDEEQEAPVCEKLPFIVVVIDELADMMMVVGKKVEQLIARIAQKARAAGIHLILATQRPSVDVLTGLIKSNIPTRISFQVSSKIDSRTILDQQGAEQLLGHGDMLYLAPGAGTPVRVHGAFVDDAQVHKVVSDWKTRGQPVYIEDVLDGPSDARPGDFAFMGGDGDGGQGDVEDTDPFYDQAVEFVISSRKASISAVQRRFKIGYNRAARLIEEMERTGIVSPMEGNGSREILVKAPLEEA